MRHTEVSELWVQRLVADNRTELNKIQGDFNTSDINIIVIAINEEIHQLQSALYECPSVDGSAPRAFVDADPTLNIGDKFDVNSYSIEEDGFEVIEKL